MSISLLKLQRGDVSVENLCDQNIHNTSIFSFILFHDQKYHPLCDSC